MCAISLQKRSSFVILAPQERCGEHFCLLASGRKLCYFKDVDGSPNPVLVLAFHGGCEGKYKFMMKSPMKDILFVSVDRPGYGKSCPAPAGGSVLGVVGGVELAGVSQSRLCFH